MKRPALVMLALVHLYAADARADQACKGGIEPSTPAERFVFHDNGTVTDKETDITWMRCALGQEWDGKTCVGSARSYKWEDTADAVAQYNFETLGESFSWRLPQIPELASIVERRCFTPRVNLAVFPATPSALFWTGTKKQSETVQVYAIDFDRGAVTVTKSDNAAAIRLMIDGPNGKWWQPRKMNKK